MDPNFTNSFKNKFSARNSIGKNRVYCGPKFDPGEPPAPNPQKTSEKRPNAVQTRPVRTGPAATMEKPIDESSFPEFSPEEEKEIFETLGVSPTVALHNNNDTSRTSFTAAAGNGTGASTRAPRVKDVVFGTLRSLKQVKVAEAPVETETVATAASSDVEDLGTVRIKLADGRSKWGTLRRHKTNPAEIVLQDLGLEESSSDSSSDSNSDANTGEADSGSGSSSATQLSGEADDDEMYSSVRIKDPSVLESLEQEYGTMRINSGGPTSPRSDEKPLWMSGGGSEEV
jgi:hypothetical protein